MTSSASAPVRVMIVDDSAVIRSVITRTLNGKPDIMIAGTAHNGDMALQNMERMDPDIIILDVEMPVMDGITALPLLLKKKPGVRVLICSTLSGRGAEISIRALSLGAAECILKPGGDAIVSASEFQESLLRVIRSLAGGVSRIGKSNTPYHNTPYTLRPGELRPAEKIVAIGSSTGGPKALIEVLTGLRNLPVPIVITQHMPKTFTAILAKNIADHCGIPCEEGQAGVRLQPGHAYVAPGGHHMVFEKDNDDAVIGIDNGPLENFCRPSVNPMVRSLIPIYGPRILCVILTGMGNDGMQACADAVKAGGQVIAQDEATSVVWGMPGAVATAGLCSAVLPPAGINEWIGRAVKGIHK